MVAGRDNRRPLFKVMWRDLDDLKAELPILPEIVHGSGPFQGTGTGCANFDLIDRAQFKQCDPQLEGKGQPFFRYTTGPKPRVVFFLRMLQSRSWRAIVSSRNLLNARVGAYHSPVDIAPRMRTGLSLIAIVKLVGLETSKVTKTAARKTGGENFYGAPVLKLTFGDPFPILS